MGDKLNAAVDVVAGLMKEVMELRLAATKLVDAMGHDNTCLAIDLGASEDCICGAWARIATARGELVRLLREEI